MQAYSLRDSCVDIQTSTSSILCSLINASFSMTLASINGRQRMTQRNNQPGPNLTKLYFELTVLHSFRCSNTTSNSNRNCCKIWLRQFFLALSSLLVGNLTLASEVSSFFGDPNDGFWELRGDEGTNMVLTGLLACDDIQESPWVDLPGFPVSWMGPKTPISMRPKCSVTPFQQPSHGCVETAHWCVPSKTSQITLP